MRIDKLREVEAQVRTNSYFTRKEYKAPDYAEQGNKGRNFMNSRNQSLDNASNQFEAKIPGRTLQEKLDRFRKTVNSVLNTSPNTEVFTSVRKKTDQN